MQEHSGFRIRRQYQVCTSVDGVRHWLWRAVDEHGFVLEVLLQRHRDTEAAKTFLTRLLSEYDVPDRICTDKLASYGAAIREITSLAEVDQQQVISTARCNNMIEQRASVPRRAVLTKTISSSHTTSRATATWIQAEETGAGVSEPACPNRRASVLMGAALPKTEPSSSLSHQRSRLNPTKRAGALMGVRSAQETTREKRSRRGRWLRQEWPEVQATPALRLPWDQLR